MFWFSFNISGTWSYPTTAYGSVLLCVRVYVDVLWVVFNSAGTHSLEFRINPVLTAKGIVNKSNSKAVQKILNYRKKIPLQ